ncbi:MAG: hypothetical protein CMH58_02875 [Myxococcales bacterium]|nr:hypothetical protein [Myxococcales bacterium]|tara:strand:- start:741 stop:1007 length:267 start_codon:yes stop_codon:yes gene_type:complete
MNILKHPKLFLALVIAVLLVALAASNPGTEDFQQWYGEKHGLAGTLLAVAVKRENRIFFSTFELGDDFFLKKRTVAVGVGGLLFELAE